MNGWLIPGMATPTQGEREDVAVEFDLVAAAAHEAAAALRAGDRDGASEAFAALEEWAASFLAMRAAARRVAEQLRRDYGEPS